MNAKANRVDDRVNRLYQEGAGERIEAELTELREQPLSPDELESWHHCWGIVAFQRGDHRDALARFEEGLRACPQSALIRFSVGQEHVLLGDAERGFREFDRCLFPSVPRDYALAAARYAYLWDQLDRGWRYVEAFLPYYYKLGVADDNFVYLRGLPFFGQAWAYLAAFAVLGNRLASLSSLTAEAEKRLTDFEFGVLRLQMQAYGTGDFRPWLASVLTRAREAEAERWPSGYLAMQGALLASGMEPNLAEARHRIDEVCLTEKDFGWLADLRLIALCELAARAEDLESEEHLKRAFLKRQPLLFEPDHAFNFNILSYQEKLKPMARTGAS
jgi:hypothetical protein